MRIVCLNLREPRAWNVHYRKLRRREIVFCPGAEGELGEQVYLRVSFVGELTVVLPTTIIVRRHRSEATPNLHVGIGLQPAAGAEGTIAFICEYAKGQRVDRRRGSRVPIVLRFTYRKDESLATGRTTNIALSGLALMTNDAIPVETRLSLWVDRPSGNAREPVEVRVVRTVPGKEGAIAGVQVEPRTGESWRDLIVECEKLFEVGGMVECAVPAEG